MSGVVRRGSQHIGAQQAKILKWQGESANKTQQQHRRRVPRNLSVEISESKEFYDTPSWKVGVGMVAVAIFAKFLMMYDESKEEERTERRAKEVVEMQESGSQTVSREVWEQLQQLRPRTPFESRVVRENARFRGGERHSLEDVKDWAFDVLVDALARKEDSLRP